MVREQGPFKLDNPWPRIAWGSIGGAVHRFVRPRASSCWADFSRTVPRSAPGPRSVAQSASPPTAGRPAEPQPPLRTPTRIAWTSATLARIASGSEQHGAFVALNCTACHGEQGVSPSTLIPTLAGMDSAVIYKQLDDYRSGKRLWGVMGAIATALTDQDSADVAAYFARRTDGLPPVAGEGCPGSGRSLRQSDPAIRLVFAGDPERGIPPCAACHGPGAQKLGAPALQGQHTDYIERQLAAFAQGMRQNDINEQMRMIAAQLTPDEMHAIAVYYGTLGAVAAFRK